MDSLNQPYGLSQKQMEQFDRDGFIHLRDVLRPNLLEWYRREISDLTIALSTQQLPISERGTYDQAFLQVMNLWTQSEKVRTFVFGARLARIAANLLGVRGVRIYHDQSLYKEPGGGITPAHADQHYWPFSSDRAITAWIPLQSVPLEMGPLAFWKGSQGIAQGREWGIGDESEREITRTMREKGYSMCEEPFDVGDVSFHLGWTFHRAGVNQSTQPRSVMTVIYMDIDMQLKSEWTAIERNDANQWCPGVQPGALADSELNPVIWVGP